MSDPDARDTPTVRRAARNRGRMARALVLAAGLALLAYLVAVLGAGAILAFLGRIGWGFLPIAALYLGYQLLRALAPAACPSPTRWRFASRARRCSR
jgi:hypothetical protein